MPLLVTQNIKDKDMFNMQQVTLQNITESTEDDDDIIFHLTMSNLVTVSSANHLYQHFVLQYTTIRVVQLMIIILSLM